MKQIFRGCLAVMVVLALCCVTVGAAVPDDTVTYEGGDAAFRLVGKTELAMEGQIVTLRVTTPNATPTLDDDEIIYIRETYTDVEGSYAFDFELDVDGEAQAVIFIEGAEKAPIALYKSTEAELSQALAAADSGIYNAVQNATHAKVLMVNPADFSSDGLLTRVIDAAADGYYQAGGLDAFNAACKVGRFLVDVKNATDAQIVLDAMTEGSNLIEVTGKHAAEVYASYTDAEKLAVLESVKGREFLSASAFLDTLYEAVIMKELADVYSDNEKYGVISDNNDFLGFDLTKYASLGSYFTSFKERVFDTPFTNKATLQSVCESVYNTLLLNMPTDDVRGTGGGGGGGAIKPVPMPTEDIKETEKPGETNSTFVDLGNYGWAQPSIEYLAARGIVSGKGNNQFYPGDSVTRGEFIKILIGALELTNVDAASSFDDVPSLHWAYPFVSSGVKLGITNGASSSEFGVNAQITRQDMAVMCHRALLYLGKDLSGVESVGFVDEAEISSYAAEAVNALAMLGVINGKDGGRFDPHAHATRAEAAKVIYLLMGRR